MTGQLNVNWAITAKTAIMAGALRELGSYQTNTSSYYQGQSVFVAPTWKATEKTAVRLRYDYGVRNFRGPLPGFAATDRRDTGSLLTLAYDWQPVRALKLTASLQRDQRRSTEPGFDYRSTALGISALASF
jgi:hypothetical protein